MRIKTNFILLIVFVSQIALGTLIPLIYGGEVSDYFMMFLTQLIPILIPSILYLQFNKAGYKAIKRDKGINVLDLIIVVFSSFAVNIVVNNFLCLPIYMLLDKVTPSEPYIHTGFEFFMDILLICIIPAMFEEILFRGITLAEYERIYGTKKALFMCAIVFSLMHGSLVALIPQFLIGLFLTYIVFKTNSVYSGVIGHFVINITTLLMQNAANDVDALLRFVISGNQFLIFIIFVLVLVMSIWLIGKLHKSNKFKKPTYNKEQIKVEKNFFVMLVTLYICIQLLTKL